jgi:hypothetical protein
MTSTLNSALTDRSAAWLRHPAAGVVRGSRQPRLHLPSAGLFSLLAPQAGSVTATTNPVGLAGLAWIVLVPAALLTVLGWWASLASPGIPPGGARFRSCR